METAVFKANAVSARAASLPALKAGLRHVAKNTTRAVVGQAIIHMAACSGLLMESLTPYLLGNQLNDSMKANAYTDLSMFGSDMVLAAKFLKCKVPGSGKKVKLAGITRTEAILRLNTYASTQLALHAAYYGDGLCADPAAQEAKDAAYLEEARQLMGSILNLYWPLVYDLLGTVPAELFSAQINAMSTSCPEGFFAHNADELKAKKKELADKKAAAAAAKAAEKPVE